MIFEKSEMIRIFKTLSGKRILLRRGRNKMEVRVKAVSEAIISINGRQNVLLLDHDTKRIPIELPYSMEAEDNAELILLDYNRPSRQEDIDREDSKFYEFLRRGKGHHFNLDDKRRPVVVIEVISEELDLESSN